MSYEMAVRSKTIEWKGDSRSRPAKFEARLFKSRYGGPEYLLEILLLIKVNKLVPHGVLPTTQDYDGTSFYTEEWTDDAFNKFLEGARAQANLWNDQFWLKPPATMKNFDEFDGTHWQRPYIKCALKTHFADNTLNPHAVIDTAKIAITKDQDPANFRSHSLLYDSADATPWVTSVMDDTGKMNSFMHATIAHEIGHKLGQPHIGVMKKVPFCEMIADRGYSANLSMCYGWNQPADVAANIMGSGMSFSAENARPWLIAAEEVCGKGVWQVLTKYPGVKYPARKGLYN